MARILSRPLARNRPLWEMVVLHGLPDGRLMIVNRVHHAMVDGLAHRDFMTTMFDDSPDGTAVKPPSEPWRPRPAPGDLALIWQQVRGLMFSPGDPGPGLLTRVGLWLAGRLAGIPAAWALCDHAAAAAVLQSRVRAAPNRARAQGPAGRLQGAQAALRVHDQ